MHNEQIIILEDIVFHRTPFGWAASAKCFDLQVLLTHDPTGQLPGWTCHVNMVATRDPAPVFPTKEAALRDALPLIRRCFILHHAAPLN